MCVCLYVLRSIGQSLTACGVVGSVLASCSKNQTGVGSIPAADTMHALHKQLGTEAYYYVMINVPKTLDLKQTEKV